MSTAEDALLDRAYPQALAARNEDLVRLEAQKGCAGDLAAEPVALEPPFQLLAPRSVVNARANWPRWTPEPVQDRQDWQRLCVWISPEQDCSWNRSELFLKLLVNTRSRTAFEIVGNSDRVSIQILCNRNDLPEIQGAFAGQFEQCALAPCCPGNDLRILLNDAQTSILFLDYYPLPPYSHLLTRPQELKRSPFTTLLSVLSSLPKGVVGLYQVVFTPVAAEHNWHRNIQVLLDLEYQVKLLYGLTPAQRYLRDAPSGDLKQMAFDLESKAHNDKPFFATALRVAVLGGGGEASAYLRALALVTGVLMHGGRPLNALSGEQYEQHLSNQAIRDLFPLGLTYRPGFLLNSEELTSLVHIPPLEALAHLGECLDTLETLPAPPELATGTPIGTCTVGSRDHPVCIPDEDRMAHMHLIGGTGVGKTTLIEYMSLYDIDQGHGIAIIDPHGGLVARMLALIPEQHIDRVIYFNPGDPEWVPVWNPFRSGALANADRLTDDLVGAFKDFITGWGDRLEHLLRHAFYAAAKLPGGNLDHASDLLRLKSEKSKEIRNQLRFLLDNKAAAQFWNEDVNQYRHADISPPQHKLSKLLMYQTVGQMLSQGESAFNLREVMDAGMILLVDLSQIGTETCNILGSFMLSLLNLTALGRKPDQSNRAFDIYCDEAPRFVTDALEDMLAQTRKFNVSLCLAHQQMSQFNRPKRDAISNTGSTVVFRVDEVDAQRLSKHLLGKVDYDDLIAQEKFRAVARIGNHVVRVQTLPWRPLPDKNFRKQIIDRSHRLYYRRVRPSGSRSQEHGNMPPNPTPETKLSPTSTATENGQDATEPYHSRESAFDTF